MSCLVEFARHEFRLGRRDKDGKSLRETLEVVAWMRGGVTPPEGANPVAFPDVLYDLWGWFRDLHAARRNDMGGAESIGYLEIQAYSSLHSIRLEGWELSAIRVLDALALGGASDEGG